MLVVYFLFVTLAFAGFLRYIVEKCAYIVVWCSWWICTVLFYWHTTSGEQNHFKWFTLRQKVCLHFNYEGSGPILFRKMVVRTRLFRVFFRFCCCIVSIKCTKKIKSWSLLYTTVTHHTQNRRPEHAVMESEMENKTQETFADGSNRWQQMAGKAT